MTALTERLDALGVEYEVAPSNGNVNVTCRAHGGLLVLGGSFGPMCSNGGRPEACLNALGDGLAELADVETRGPADLIEVEGLMVPRRDFEKVKRDRLVWRLADRAAIEDIEAAEIAQVPDKWLTGDALLDIDEVSPIWGTPEHPWTAHGQTTLLVGPDSTGKSTLCAHYAKARIALPNWGGELLGDPVKPLPEDQTVIYLAADRPIQIMEGLQRGLTEAMRSDLRRRLLIWPGPPPMGLDTSAGRLWLLRKVEEVNAGLVFIDSRKDVGDVMEAREVNRLNRLTKQLDADGVEVFIPHHNIQSADGPNLPPDLTHVFGHREVYSGTGSVLMIKGKKGAEVVKLHQVKPIRDFHPMVEVRWDKPAGRGLVKEPVAKVEDKETVSVDLSEYDGDEHEAHVLAVLGDAGADGLMTTKVTGSGEHGKPRRAALYRLEGKGLVVSLASGTGKRWWLKEYTPE